MNLPGGLVAEGLSAKTEGAGSAEVPSGEQIVGVALGTYNPNSTEAFFKTAKSSPPSKRGVTRCMRSAPVSGANDLFLLFHRFEYRGVLAIAPFWKR